MNRIRIIITGIVVTLLVIAGLWEAFKWTQMRVYVDNQHALVVINKFGKSLPPERIVVPREDNSFKGVQEDVLGPGRYFFDPIEYDTKLVDLQVISAGNPEKWSWTADGVL